MALLPHTTEILVSHRRLFEAITGFDIHRGCLAIADRPRPSAVDELMAKPNGPMVVLENCNNADNMGGVFRNALAFGACGVLLSPLGIDPFYRKSIRTSMGAVLEMPFARTAQWPSALELLHSHAFTIVALTPTLPSLTLNEFSAAAPARRIAWLLGAEGDGLSAAALAAADVRVRIPIAAAVDSLNLAVAAGIALARFSSL
jgi:tRNA G18 (ribose-2'-O)-methylase SpoU